MRPHLPSIRGRARADLGPLVLAVLVVALAAALAGAVPAAGRRAADRAVAADVARAGDDAALLAAVPLGSTQLADTAQREPQSAGLTDSVVRSVSDTLPVPLAGVLRPAAARVVSEPLGVFGHGTGRSLVLAYVASATGDPRVVWTAGRPPGGSVPPGRERLEWRRGATPWRVEVGLSEPAAAALGVRAGARLAVEDKLHQEVDVRVTGVYRVVDPTDVVWRAVPALARPTSFADDGGHTFVAAAGLLSRASLPDARISIDEDEMSQQVLYLPDPARFTSRNAADVLAATVRLQTGTGVTSVLSDQPRWTTSLDAVLQRAVGRVAAARAQAAVLLAGLVAAAALVVVLAADLLVRRRAGPLAGARVRGATLAGLGLELGVESVAVAALGAALGTLVAVRLGGDVGTAWLVPLLVVTVLAPPVAGMRAAASGAGGRRPPANPSARRALARTRQLRTVAVEGALVLVAVGAFAALRQRGVAAGGDLLPALAPTVGALTGAVLLRRALPVGTRFAVTRAIRSRRALPLVAAARATTAAARSLPFVVVAVSTALLGLGAAVVATEDSGQGLAAWQAVGADVRVGTAPSAGDAQLAERLAHAPGVRAAVAARVVDDVSVSGNAGGGRVRLVVVDGAAYGRLLAATPLPGTVPADDLAAPGGRLPVLLRSSQRTLLESTQLHLAWRGRDVPVRVVGAAPAGGEDEEEVVVVDARRGATAGLDTTPDTVWVVGPGAEQAVAAAHPDDATVTRRADVLRARAAEPLPAALRGLAAVSTAVLVVLAVLGLVLGAATSARDRGETLARLRTLGLRRRETWRVALGELLPAALVAALGGLAVGVLLARISLAPLALRLVTGQSTDPALVVPWWTVVPALAVVSSLVGVVAVESSLRRRERLGLVLRAGGG